MPGKIEVKINLKRCHWINSIDEAARKLKPVSTASNAKAIIPVAKVQWTKDRLSLIRRKTDRPPQKKASDTGNQRVKVHGNSLLGILDSIFYSVHVSYGNREV